MTTIKRNAIVPHTPRQMFELVSNIEDYPRFLPWCSGSHINSRDEKQVEARLDISWSGMSKSFATRDILYPYERIDMELVEGPFKHLNGRWDFIALGEHGCKVNMELDFELTGHFLDFVFLPVFNHIANSLVDAFCKRAVEVYGTR